MQGTSETQKESVSLPPMPPAAPQADRAGLPLAARRAVWAAFLGWTLDAFDFVLYLMAIPVLREEFGLDARSAGWLASAALLSSAAGGVASGFLADRFGRSRVLAWTILVYSLASLGTATSQSIRELLVWRILLGFGMGGEWSAGSVLVAESVPPDRRGRAIGWMQSGWALGYLLAALAAAWILPWLGWRALFVLGVTPALLVFWIRRRVAEPELWLRRSSSSRLAPAWRLPFAALSAPAVRGRLLAAALTSSSVMFGYWGLFTWIPSFLASPVEAGGAGLGIVRTAGWIVPMQLGAWAGYLSFGFAADRLGRRPAFAGFLVAAALFVPLFGQLVSEPGWLLALAFPVGFFGHGYFSLFGAHLAEIFPTSIRGLAQGLAYNAGRAFSALAPAVFGAISDMAGYGVAVSLASVGFGVGALLIYTLPETRGSELPA